MTAEVVEKKIPHHSGPSRSKCGWCLANDHERHHPGDNVTWVCVCPDPRCLKKGP